jgi:hypothetical protein
VIKRSNIENIIRKLVLVCGLLAITISSLNYLIQERIVNDLSQIEINDEEENPEKNYDFIYLPDYLASISSFQIDVDLILNILFDIPFSTEDKCWHEHVLEYSSTSFFKILFQNIISPNAP